MEVIKLILEYGTNPIWIRHEDFCESDMIPEEALDNEELVRLNNDIQQKFDSLFINTKYEFAYVGFKTKEESHAFLEELRYFSKLCRSIFEGKYGFLDLFPYHLYE